MNKADFLKILENYQRGTVTAEERAMLIAYYDTFERELDVLTTISESERQVLKEEILENILKKIDDLAKSVQDKQSSTTINQKD